MRWWLALTFALLPMSVAAQQDDRDYLTAFLEDNLSGAGRQVTITGFEGVLSSRATIERIQIADQQGVWVTLDDVVLDWSRSSLLSGELVVDQLSAGAIVLERLPELASESGIPDPEAAGFALPDLPVSVDIGRVEAAQISLGQDVLGEPVEGRLEASLTLAGGEGAADLVLERTDGPESRISLAAGYANATTSLTLNLQANEAAGGLISGLLGLPGGPSIALSIQGEGSVSDFSANLQLATDGIVRLSGPVTITDDGPDASSFAAEVEGDLAPLFLPDYAAFLGDRVALSLAGKRWSSGRIVLDRMAVEAGALRLGGRAEVAGDGLPEFLDLTLDLGLQSGAAVTLPLTGEATLLQRAELEVTYDARADAGWKATGRLTALERGGLTVGEVQLAGSGRIGRQGDRRRLGATLDFEAVGLALADTAAAAALGDGLTGRVVLHWLEGDEALNLPVLELRGADYGVKANLRIEGLSSGLRTGGNASLSAGDLSRFATLAGLPLKGRGEIRLAGSASGLSGRFDGQIAVTGHELAIGVPQLDRLFSEETSLMVSGLRDETGTVLRSLDLAARTVRLSASGTISSLGSRLDGRVTIGSLSDLEPAWGGSLSADAQLTGTLDEGILTVSGTGQSLSSGQADVDRVIAGNTVMQLVLNIRDWTAQLSSAQLRGANLEADIRGQAGTSALLVTGRLRDLALLSPELPGPVSLSGRLLPLAPGYDLDLRLLGPAGSDLAVKGRVSGSNADLRMTGTSNAELLNTVADPASLSGILSVDLALKGPLALQSLSGRLALSGGRVAYPMRGLALGRTEVVADLTQGRARVSATADLQSGGRIRVDGTLGMAAPFVAALDITLDGARMRDAELFDATIQGALSLTGPVLNGGRLSGDLQVREAELLVPATGFASAADLEGIRHVKDSGAVQMTRRRAGIGSGSGAGSNGDQAGDGPNWILDVLIDAPNRVFLRGRGLDAELGGSVRLGGSLRSVQPAGSIGLIRGRLDLLGKRLDLVQADLVLQGALVPYLTIVASNQTEGVTSMVTIEGPASAPEVVFSSIPELPQEEVLAWLLFGSGLQSLSAFQAVQMANAVAVLAGRGGTGVVDRLRQGFGFDDLDFSTAEDGTASVSAGKYISRNVYTEIEVDQSGKSQIMLNLDLKPGVTVKGTVGSDGQTGIGVFLEKDY